MAIQPNAARPCLNAQRLFDQSTDDGQAARFKNRRSENPKASGRVFALRPSRTMTDPGLHFKASQGWARIELPVGCLDASNLWAGARKRGPKCRYWSRRSARKLQARYPRDMFDPSPSHAEVWAFRISDRKRLSIRSGRDRQDSVRQTPQPSRLFSLNGEMSDSYATAEI